MKLLTEKEIEKLGLQEKFLNETGESYQDFPYSFSIYCFKYAQKLLLESASEGYREWIKSHVWISDPAKMSWCHEAWQASSISNAKKMQEKDAEIESLKRDLKYLLKGTEYFRLDMQNECEEIRKRHNLKKGI